MGFQLVQQMVTLNDLERHKLIEDISKLSATKM